MVVAKLSQESYFAAAMSKKHNRLLGIAAGLAAGALWGLPFVAPTLLEGESPLNITLARFLGFGAASVLWLFFDRSGLSFLREHFLRAVLFSLLGFTLYSFLLFWGVSLTDPVISSLIVGFLPVSIALLASGGRGLSRGFWVGVAICVVGIVSSQAEGFLGQQSLFKFSTLGYLLLLLCLALWSVYAVANARFLKANPKISSLSWCCSLGLVSLVLVLPLLVLRLSSNELVVTQKFLLMGVALGFGSSWLANVLWNYASQHLPSHLLGPLITSETFFGVVYGHLIGAVAWSWMSVVALSLMIAGVVVALRPAARRASSALLSKTR